MINQYLLKKTIGSGSFAKVKLCRDKNKNIEYAMKIMKKKVL
jgi:serine/threonine protein kinase